MRPEVVGSVLDRIDALHPSPHYCTSEDNRWDCYSGGTADDLPWPCPTRRLTAEIREEMSHADMSEFWRLITAEGRDADHRIHGHRCGSSREA